MKRILYPKHKKLARVFVSTEQIKFSMRRIKQNMAIKAKRKSTNPQENKKNALIKKSQNKAAAKRKKVPTVVTFKVDQKSRNRSSRKIQ